MITIELDSTAEVTAIAITSTAEEVLKEFTVYVNA